MFGTYIFVLCGANLYVLKNVVMVSCLLPRCLASNFSPSTAIALPEYKFQSTLRFSSIFLTHKLIPRNLLKIIFRSSESVLHWDIKWNKAYRSDLENDTDNFILSWCGGIIVSNSEIGSWARIPGQEIMTSTNFNITMQRRYKALWLNVPSKMAIFNQSECVISVFDWEAVLNFVNDIGSKKFYINQYNESSFKSNFCAGTILTKRWFIKE